MHKKWNAAQFYFLKLIFPNIYFLAPVDFLGFLNQYAARSSNSPDSSKSSAKYLLFAEPNGRSKILQTVISDYFSER